MKKSSGTIFPEFSEVKKVIPEILVFSHTPSLSLNHKDPKLIWLRYRESRKIWTYKVLKAPFGVTCIHNEN